MLYIKTIIFLGLSPSPKIISRIISLKLFYGHKSSCAARIVVVAGNPGTPVLTAIFFAAN